MYRRSQSLNVLNSSVLHAYLFLSVFKKACQWLRPSECNVVYLS